MSEQNDSVATAHKLQWHPAFYAGIQIEFAKESDKLIFENEHHVGTKPKQIDVLIVKKENNTPIQKNIGRIFRKHNIIEYKSPTDYLSIDDYYLVYAYACLYKSDTNTADEISIKDITITFVCSHYPRELINHLKKIRTYDIQLMEKGIYYVKGDFFPIQIILTSKLTDDENLWLHNLTDKIQDSTVIHTLLNEYEQHKNENLYRSVMNIITNANNTKFKEVTVMCEALERIYLEVHGERLEREQQEAIDRGIEEGLQKAVAEALPIAVAEAVAEKDAYIKKLEAQLAMQNLQH